VTVLSDDQVRLNILRELLQEAKENPGSLGMDRTELKDKLNVPEKQMDFNMLYLEEKRLVKLIGYMGVIWSNAKITAFGIDVITHKEQFASQFPFLKISIQQINAPVQGNVIQAVDSTIIFNQQVSNAFREAYNKVDAKTDIPTEKKQEIKDELKVLEEELLKEEKDAGRIQKAWDLLRRNANWLAPILTTVVLEGIKIALGIS
jgi:hypothetical protein